MHGPPNFTFYHAPRRRVRGHRDEGRCRPPQAPRTREGRRVRSVTAGGPEFDPAAQVQPVPLGAAIDPLVVSRRPVTASARRGSAPDLAVDGPAGGQR